MDVVLWIVQGFLVVPFLAVDGMKLFACDRRINAMIDRRNPGGGLPMSRGLERFSE